MFVISHWISSEKRWTVAGGVRAPASLAGAYGDEARIQAVIPCRRSRARPAGAVCLPAGSERHDGVVRSARPGPCLAANSAGLRPFFLTTRQPPLDRSRMNDDTEALCDATGQIC